MNKSIKVAAMSGVVGLSLFAATGSLIASAASSTNGKKSLASAIASKFGLSESDVQSVIDDTREQNHTAMEAEIKTKVADAVTSGKITQAQADLWQRINDYRKANRQTVKPDDSSRRPTRTEMEAKMVENKAAMLTALGITESDLTALQTAFENADLPIMFGGPRMRHGGMHGAGMMRTESNN